MPNSGRYGKPGGLPGTLRRSCREAQAVFMQAYDEAARTYGEKDQAHRVAYAALKHKSEKRGGHWIAKRDLPASARRLTR